MNRYEEACFSADCLVIDLYANEEKMKATKSTVEIRLFDDATGKAFYKKLNEFELYKIKKVLDIESIK